jgi:molybdopterin-guanine dinucleotide biosynthesis protein A
MTRIPRTAISALILAGGRAQRMDGCDKGLVEFQDRPMICHAIALLKPQLDLIRINANRNQATYAALGLSTEGLLEGSPSERLPSRSSKGATPYPALPFEVISDSMIDFQGPLAGIAQGLKTCPTPWMLVVPCDTPFLPLDLVERLATQAEQHKAEIAVAHDGQRMQPVVSLINRELLGSLQHYLDAGDRKIDRWYATHKLCCVDFSDQPQAFLNINSLKDMQLLENRPL